MSGGNANGVQIATAQPEGLVVRFDTGLYRPIAIQKAAHKFGDRCHVLVRNCNDKQIEVVLKAKRPLDNPEFIAGEFCNEVLDQELREVVHEQTSGIKNLLLAHAFSNTALINEEFDTAAFEEDPCGIHVADRQKAD